MSELVLENEKENLPKGWIYCILKDIANEVNSGFPSGKHNKEQKGIPHIRPMNIDYNGNIDLSVVKYVENNTYDHLRKGDVLFNNTNSPKLLGKTALIKQDTDWAYSNHMTRIRFDISLIEPKWIAYFLHKLFWEGYYKIRATNHVNQSSITSTYLSKQIPILFPPLNEQKRIVTKIEELFSLMESTKKLLENTQILLKQFHRQFLGFALEGKLFFKILNHERFIELDTKPLNETIIKIIDHRGVTPKKLGGDWVKNGVPVLSARNIKNYRLAKRDQIRFITKEMAKKWMPDNVQHGDLLMTSEGATLGELALLNENTKFCLGQRLFGIRTNDKILDSNFLYYYLISHKGQQEIFSHATGTTVSGLRQTELEKLSILFPLIHHQKRIVTKIEEVVSWTEKIENLVNLLLSQNNSMKKSILKQAFEGKLIPQDPNDEPAEVLLEKIKQEKQKIISQTKRGKKNDK